MMYPSEVMINPVPATALALCWPNMLARVLSSETPTVCLQPSSYISFAEAVSVLTLLPTVVPDMGLTELSFAVPSARFPLTAFHEMKPPTSPPTNAHTRHMHASFSVPLRCASPDLSRGFFSSGA